MPAHSMSDSDPDDPPPSKKAKLSHKKKPVESGARKAFTSDFISEEDEVFIIKVPLSIKPNELHNIAIPGKSKKTFSIGNRTLETSLDKSKSSQALVFSDGRLQKKCVTCVTAVECKGVLKIGEHVEVPEVPEIKIPPPHFVPTPSVKENRHPIYGIGYKPVRRKAKTEKTQEDIAKTSHKKHKKKKSKKTAH